MYESIDRSQPQKTKYLERRILNDLPNEIQKHVECGVVLQEMQLCACNGDIIIAQYFTTTIEGQH